MPTIRSALLFAACMLLLPATLPAQNWMEKAQLGLTCTSKASAAERASLAVQWFPSGRAVTQQEMQVIRNYVTGKGARDEEKLFRYLTLLAGFSYQADYSNDQYLRSRFDGLVLGHSATAVDHATPNLMTQVFLCSQARLISATIESGDANSVNSIGIVLAQHYARLSTAVAVNDWPLIEALRLVAVSPTGHERALNDLTAAALNRAMALEKSAPRRASRLYSEAAATRLALGNPQEALAIGGRAILFAPAAEKAAAAWRAYPAMFDALKITQESEPPTAIAFTEGFFTNYDYPEDSGDFEIDFEINLRLAEAFRELGYDNTNFWVLAFNSLRKLNHGIVTHSFLRRGLRRLAAATDAPVDVLLKTRTMNDLPASEIARARQLFDYVQDQRRNTIQIDVGSQSLLSFMNESVLYSLSRLQPRNAQERDAVEDLAFRALQLDSFTRISVAAASTGIRNLDMDRDRRFHLERFYTYTADHSAWLDATGLRIAVGPGQTIPGSDELWTSFMVISTFQNETEAELQNYYAILKQLAPETFAMTVPYTQSLDEFRKQLGPGEAVFASVVGTSESYVWGIAADRVHFARANAGAAEIAESVGALRASLAATGGGGQLSVPPYEAGVAFDLYSSTIARVLPGLQGAKHVYWYGDGALGALPPAILVTRAPARNRISSLAEFNDTQFLVDDFSLSALPDLYLGKTAFLHPNRDATGTVTFAGFGAPLLSDEELQQDTLSSSFELAGGVAVDELRSLAKLPAAKTELDSLGSVFDSPDIWLGREASEANLRTATLSSYRVLAFATHGFTRSDIKGQIYPSLLMAPPETVTSTINDGLLTTLEIGRLELDADLVLLSACNTATSDGRPDAEAFSGLAQAFMVAGARSLLVSHWPVASGAASDLSVDTVSRWQSGVSLPLSLQESIQKMRRNATTDIEAHPFYWGPFVLANDGGQTAVDARATH